MKIICNKASACILAVAAMLSALSCSPELTAEVGAQDSEDCYGIYFPSQEGTGDLQIGPDDPKTLTFKVRRTNTRGRVEVPVTIECEQPGIFTATEVCFEEDSPTAELSVHFPSVQLGVKYDCTIMIEGQEYVSKYSQNASHLSFSITCVKWNRLVGDNGETTGLWRDGVFAEWFSLANPNAERAVEIYERDDMPGYYRIYNVYDAAYLTDMFQMNASSICLEKHYTYIDATDPEKVWIPKFKTGIVMSAEYGEMSIASYVTENEDFDPSISSIYGTLEDGVISFPANSLQLHFAVLGWYPSNSYGLHRIILPGSRAMDNTITIKAGITDSNGMLPVDVSMGRDIATLKLYAAEGALAESVAATLAEDIAAGRVETELDDMKGSGRINLSFEKTGTYTLVAVGLDADGALAGYASESFGYKASGDSMDVELNFGLIRSGKYAPDGMTEENSLEIYINGKDIKRLHAALYEKEKFENNRETFLEALENTEMNEESLALVNGPGLSLVQSGLVPGTEYVLVLRAYNGYSETDFYATESTGGEWDYRLAYYTSDDIDADAMFNVISGEAYYGTYNYYAMEGSSSRKYLGKVVIEPSATTYQGQPCVKVSGLFPFLRDTYGVTDDSMDFYYYNGYIYNYAMRTSYFIFEGMYVYMSAMMYESSGSAYGGQGGLLGAFVKKQGKSGAKTCIALMDSGAGASQGLSFEGLAILGYEDANLSVPVGLLDLVESIVLVPESEDPDPMTDNDGLAETDRTDMEKAGHLLFDSISSGKSFRPSDNVRNYLDLTCRDYD